jgi:peptidoglycan-associated lipoprotein
MMKSLRPTVGALAVLALLAGCSSVKLDDKAPVESRSPTDSAGMTPGAGNGTAQSQVATVDLNRGAQDVAAAGKIVYFDFDSFVVKDEYRPVVELHAKALSGNRQKKLSIEGHTDERGGREYNLALGQKRAEAVAKALTLLGAQDAQIEAVSFGKERPAVQGSDEVAWAKNRRAELKDR